MKKNAVIIIVLVIVAAGLGAYFYLHNQAKAPTDESNQYQSQSSASPSPSPATATPNTQANIKGGTGTDYTPPKDTTGGEVAAPNIQVVEIDYDGSQFTPASVNIKAGDYVFFKNKGGSDFWPASNPHPTHTDYPGFDALKTFAPGTTYKFQFNKVGTWGFHDHLNPVAHGKVIVTQ